MGRGPSKVELAASQWVKTHGPITEANADEVARAIYPNTGCGWDWAQRIVHAIARYGKGPDRFAQLSGPEKHYWRHTRNFPTKAA